MKILIAVPEYIMRYSFAGADGKFIIIRARIIDNHLNHAAVILSQHERSRLYFQLPSFAVHKDHEPVTTLMLESTYSK